MNKLGNLGKRFKSANGNLNAFYQNNKYKSANGIDSINSDGSIDYNDGYTLESDGTLYDESDNEVATDVESYDPDSGQINYLGGGSDNVGDWEGDGGDSSIGSGGNTTGGSNPSTSTGSSFWQDIGKFFGGAAASASTAPKPGTYIPTTVGTTIKPTDSSTLIWTALAIGGVVIVVILVAKRKS